MSTSYNKLFGDDILNILKEIYEDTERDIALKLFNDQLKDIIEERKIEKQIEPLRLQSLYAMRPKL